MKKMLNTLYITSEEAYLSLNGEVVEILFSDGTRKGIPLHTLESIIMFTYKGASPALMGKCEEMGITMSFFSPFGKYYASVGAACKGNVLLRKTQSSISGSVEGSINIAKNIIIGKLYNSRQVLLRVSRDHPLQIDKEKVKLISDKFKRYIDQVEKATSKESVIGIEGAAATDYFSTFNELLLQQKDEFKYILLSRKLDDASSVRLNAAG